MGNINKCNGEIEQNNELEKIYQIYLQVQSGNRDALNKLFKAVNSKKIYRIDEMNKEYKLSHMDNVLDSESVLKSEKDNQEKEWIDSVYSNVAFQFPCLNKMLNKKKKNFVAKSKRTGFENGKKKRDNSFSKFYEGEYDISDFNELMFETVIEIFNEETDEDNCLTLDGKKNEKYPICDGLSLLRNISYFTSRKINKRAKNSCLDILDTESEREEPGSDFSSFDKYVYKKFVESGRGKSRLMIYTEYLEWLRKYDIYKLFKANAYDIQIIIDTIMKNDEIFMKDMSGDNEIGFGMRFVTQEMLQEIINFRHGINIQQENVSKDLKIIEQRLLDHLFYSLNYRIDKAEESKGIYEKESERCLYKLDKKAYTKMFSSASYEIYGKSVNFINSDANSNDYERYFRMTKKYEDMIISTISLKKGKKKYDMVNLISDNNDDLVDDKIGTLLSIAETMIAFYQNKEDEYKRKHFCEYKMKGLKDWENGFWEARLEDGIINIKLWSSKDVKFPIHHKINRENVMVYCGFMNFYFCDKERMICYKVPKDRRVIGRYNKNHELFLYFVG